MHRMQHRRTLSHVIGTKLGREVEHARFSVADGRDDGTIVGNVDAGITGTRHGEGCGVVDFVVRAWRGWFRVD